MYRQARFALTLVAIAFIASCGEAPSSPERYQRTNAANAIVPGTCATLTDLQDLAGAVFLTASPNVNSVRGKINVLGKAVEEGRFADAIAQAHLIVDFTLGHYEAGRLPGTEEQLTAFVNSIYCFAGIDIGINEPSNSHLILPSDGEQIVYSIDQQAAIKFQANPVSEPTLIEFQQIEDTYEPGAGPLDTKLDQYPGFITITKSSETNAPLTKSAVVGICASGVIPQEVRDDLRLGHGAASGFEIAEQADASFLDCENLVDEQVSRSGMRRAFDAVLDFVQPTKLHARNAMFFRGGGIGGTVTEFSPFAPVDINLRSGGGIGGTVTEFIRAPMSNLLLSESVLPVETCTTITGLPGAPVSEACRPFVRITTRLGTHLADVPVDWAVTLGGGLVAAKSTEGCGAYAAMVLSPTDLFGRSTICWKLGEPGANQVTATPRAGGDAPAGVTFEPATVTFDAEAVPADAGVPKVLTIIEGAGQTAPAGHSTPVAPQVRVTDPYGNPVAGIPVKWEVREGTGSVTPVSLLSDADGRASATWILGAGYNKLKAYIDHTVFVYVYFEGTGTVAP